jgi:hypothetical protein
LNGHFDGRSASSSGGEVALRLELCELFDTFCELFDVALRFAAFFPITPNLNLG